jgi:DNA repair exonuclease SbcCD ATPase subunit
MKQNWISRYWWVPVLFAGIGLSSFSLFNLPEEQDVMPPNPNIKVMFAQLKDTVPPGADDENNDWEFRFKTGDIDKAIKDMEKEIERAKKDFANRDWPNVEEQMKKALKEMEKVDLKKIKAEIEQSLKKVDWEKIEKELKESLKQMEMEQLNMKKHLEENITRELEETEKQLKRNEKELLLQGEKLRGEIKQSMAETMKNLDKNLAEAKTQLLELKKMTEEMEKDGLLKKGESADIRYKNGELFINKKKQPKEITDKYKRYFKKGSVRINLKEDDDGWI